MADIKDGPITLTADHLNKIFGISNGSTWIGPMKKYCEEAGINTLLRYAAFFGQVAVESGRLQVLTENFNYSASGLLKTFPSHFDSASAAAYAKNPQRIASRIYANKIGNGPEASGDGYVYRGRGLIQVAGKSNYLQCSKTGVPCYPNPDYAATVEGAVRVSVWFWKSHGLNALADQKNWNKITRIINGSYIALDKRINFTNRALAVLSGQSINSIPNVPPSKTTATGQENADPHKWGRIDQPISKRHSVYPYNWVYQSRSGHVFEVDDTPDYERLMMMHRSGTFIEVDPDGTFVKKSLLDDYEFVDGDKFISIGDTKTEKIGSTSYTKAGGAITYDTDGSFNIVAGDTARVKAPILTFDKRLTGPDADFEKVEVSDNATISKANINNANINKETVGHGDFREIYANSGQFGSLSSNGGSIDSITIGTATIDVLHVNTLVCHNVAQIIAAYAQQATKAGVANQGSVSVSIPNTIGDSFLVPSVTIDTQTIDNQVTNTLATTQPVSNVDYGHASGIRLPEPSAFPHSSAVYTKVDGSSSVVVSDGTNWKDVSTGNVVVDDTPPVPPSPPKSDSYIMAFENVAALPNPSSWAGKTAYVLEADGVSTYIVESDGGLWVRKDNGLAVKTLADAAGKNNFGTIPVKVQANGSANSLPDPTQSKNIIDYFKDGSGKIVSVISDGTNWINTETKGTIDRINYGISNTVTDINNAADSYLKDINSTISSTIATQASSVTDYVSTATASITSNKIVNTVINKAAAKAVQYASKQVSNTLTSYTKQASGMIKSTVSGIAGTTAAYVKTATNAVSALETTVNGIGKRVSDAANSANAMIGKAGTIYAKIKTQQEKVLGSISGSTTSLTATARHGSIEDVPSANSVDKGTPFVLIYGDTPMAIFSDGTNWVDANGTIIISGAKTPVNNETFMDVSVLPDPSNYPSPNAYYLKSDGSTGLAISDGITWKDTETGEVLKTGSTSATFSSDNTNDAQDYGTFEYDFNGNPRSADEIAMLKESTYLSASDLPKTRETFSGKAFYLVGDRIHIANWVDGHWFDYYTNTVVA